MAYTYPELKEKKLTELKDIASKIEHEAVQGYTQLNKEHLLSAICKALDIEEHEHHEVVGVNKKALKVAVKKLRKKRDQALEDHNSEIYRKSVRNIKTIKRKLRKSMV